jgi:hypothetical protein
MCNIYANEISKDIHAKVQDQGKLKIRCHESFTWPKFPYHWSLMCRTGWISWRFLGLLSTSDTSVIPTTPKTTRLDIVSKLISAPKHKRYPTLSANIHRLPSMFHCPYFTVFHAYQHSAARGGIKLNNFVFSVHYLDDTINKYQSMTPNAISSCTQIPHHSLPFNVAETQPAPSNKFCRSFSSYTFQDMASDLWITGREDVKWMKHEGEYSGSKTHKTFLEHQLSWDPYATESVRQFTQINQV